MTGAAATKAYRCPGCDHEVLRGTPHLVVWPDEARLGVEPGAESSQRRHWHTPCWRARRQGRTQRKRRPGP